jgi:hypothetical protein
MGVRRASLAHPKGPTGPAFTPFFPPPSPSLFTGELVVKKESTPIMFYQEAHA